MSTRAPRIRRRLALLMLGAMLQGCGRDPGDDGHASGVGPLGLLLRPASGSAIEPAKIRVVQRLEAPPEIEPWRVSAERAWMEGDTLWLKGMGPHRIRIPGPFDPRAFDQAALNVVATSPISVRLHWMRGEQEAMGTSRIHLPRVSEAPQTVLFTLLGNRGRTGDYTGVELEVEGWNAPPGEPLSWGLCAFDLVDRPAASWLPAGPEQVRLVQVGYEARRGFGLSSGEPLSGEFRSPAGGRLQYGYGWPKVVREGGGIPTLAVRLTSAGEPERVLRHAFEAGAREEWSSSVVELAGLEGREVRVRFELETPDGSEAVCALGEPEVYVPEEAPASVLLVTSDTHRADHLGAASGSVDVRTPALDRLAARGLLFEDCFATTNVTLPSHIALMTAVHPRDVGIYDNRTTLSERAETLAERFQEAGYLTLAVVSASHMDADTSGLGQGFHRMSWPAKASRKAGRSLVRLEAWIAETQGRPLFCWLHLYDAHVPYLPPKVWGELYWPEDRDPCDPSLPAPDFPVPMRLPELRDPEWVRAQYRGEVSYLDGELGRLLESPRFAQGIIAVTGDHGESLGEHAIWWDHKGLYPNCLRVPLILAWPGSPAGMRIEGQVRHTDLGRTLLDLAGLRSARFPGRSLLRWMDGPDEESEPRMALAANRQVASVTDGDWHLILNLRRWPRGDLGASELVEAHTVELYHLGRDPDCLSDLMEIESQRARQMRALLVEWMGAARPTGWADARAIDDELQRQLAQLGYAADTEPPEGEELFDPGCSCEHCARFRP